VPLTKACAVLLYLDSEWGCSCISRGRTPPSAPHDVHTYLSLLRRDGSMTLVGLPEKPLAVPAFGLTFERKSLPGSPIGGIAETQEMLDFCKDRHYRDCRSARVVGSPDRTHEFWP
jgi:hypothetical protein